MQHCFVFYKLEQAAALELEPRIRAMLQSIHAATGVATRLMRRADGESAVTLLEAYEGIAEPAAFDMALATAVAQARLPAALVAQRRSERFEEC